MTELLERPRPKVAGRRPRRAMVETTINLDAAELGLLDEVADELQRSRSDLIREAIRKTWLKGRKPRANRGLMEVIERIWARIPGDIDEKQLEDDIQATKLAARASRRAGRASGG